MTDDQLETTLSAWLKETVPPSPSPATTARSVLGRIEPRPRRSAFAPILLAASVGTIAIAVLAFTVASSLDDRGAVSLPAGASAPTHDGDAPVHWQTPVIDLRADHVELRIGDEVYTGAQVDRVDGSGYTRAISVQPMWLDDGQTLWLSLIFASDDLSWTSGESELSLDGILRAGETDIQRISYPEDGPPEVERRTYGTYVAFDPSDRIGMPLREAYEGDWQLRGRMEMPMCGSRELTTVDVTLTFEGLRLAVAPRDPSLVEQVAEILWGRFTALGPLVHGELPRFEPHVLQCPDPTAGAVDDPEGPMAPIR
jgi:hypothetical protein